MYRFTVSSERDVTEIIGFVRKATSKSVSSGHMEREISLNLGV